MSSMRCGCRPRRDGVRRETRAERQAWTEHFSEDPKLSKYSNVRTPALGRWFDSAWEAEYAIRLDAVFRAGQIRDLRFQVPIELVPGNGKLRAIKYIADYEYYDLDGTRHVVDAKSSHTCKLPVYRLKRRLLQLLHGVEIEEVYKKGVSR